MAGSKAVQVLDFLKKISDEKHPVTQKQLRDTMEEEGSALTLNAMTLANVIDDILYQINPKEYKEEKDHLYRIKYEGYEEDRLDLKIAIKENKNQMRCKDADIEQCEMNVKAALDTKKKALPITNLRYIHDFSYEEMDQLIQAVSFSAMFSPEVKKNLIKKIMNTASMYYETPFYDKRKGTLKFNEKGVFNRTYQMPSGIYGENRENLAQNVATIQRAINDGVRIRFHFNTYDARKERVQIKRQYEISPYHIVVYQDMYYLIGAVPNRKDEKSLSHYRIDLMSDIEVVFEKKGKPMKNEPKSQFDEFNTSSKGWNPVKYMSEHLYMGYDKPRTIGMLVPNTEYTKLHDWFGDYYRKVTPPNDIKPFDRDKYDYVEVVTSPKMMVHWAMQYGDIFEIMDEDVREEIRNVINRMSKKYFEEK